MSPFPGFTEAADALFDRLIIPSFTRLGPVLRRRIFDWQEPDVVGKRIAITGPTSGLGRAAACRMSALGADLVLLARNPDKAAKLARDLPGSSRTVIVDLSDLATVRRAAQELAELSHLDVLIHNGGALHNERQLSVDGLEMTIATHVVAPFVLTAGASPALARATEGRIITVSSGGLYSQALALDDFENAHDYKGAVAYARAKRAQLALTSEWARRLAPEITAHAMHPGWAATPGVADALPGFDKLMGPLLRSPEEGADTIVWLAGAPVELIRTGGFWLDRRRRPTAYRRGTDASAVDIANVWELTDELATRSEGEPSPPAS